jgi:SHS2 domain-containing protein
MTGVQCSQFFYYPADPESPAAGSCSIHMSFEELDHTADVKIRIKAATLEELFGEAARALMHVMYGGALGGHIKRTIRLTSHDNVALLHDFLSEVLFVSEVDGLVFSSFHVRIDNHSLVAIMEGECFDPVKHGGGMEVKGISYSGLQIVKEHDAYIIDILFDV